ncbi:MAG: YceI family protein [Halioglobus sp.]
MNKAIATLGSLTKTFFRTSALAVLLLAPGIAHASWQIDSAHSVVNFVSIKNGSVAESHRFDEVVGVMNEAGLVRIAIDLDSVDTMIGIRDERLRELLFETGKYPVAELEAIVDSEALAAVSEGGIASMDLPVTINLHGIEKTVSVALVAANEGGGRIRVMTSRPVLINAADFSLVSGIAALQKVAGLKSIATAVPVTFQLVFEPSK